MLFFPIVILSIVDDDDRDFMQKLYIEHHSMMFRMAYSLTQSRQDAEDVVSDACVSLIRKTSVLRQFERNVLRGYIISTVKNAAYALHRKRKAYREVPDGEEKLNVIANDTSAPDARIIQQCTIDELVNALSRLPESDQAVIRMMYFQHLTCAEIAGVLGIKETGVRTKVFRARQKLYQLLEASTNGE